MRFINFSRSPFGKFISRRKLFFTGVFLLLACIFSPMVRYYVRSVVEFPIHYREYREFGIRIPSGYEVHGIDVSRWQDRMDWQRVKAMSVGDIRLTFCFIKATEGAFRKDPEFDRNWENARRNGLIRGAYHYFRPGHSANLQIWNFKRAVALKKGDLPPVLDVEENGNLKKEDLQKLVKEWLVAMEARYGVRPILYTGKDFYLKYFHGEKAFEPYKLWIAHYYVSDLDLPKATKWQFWQHSDRGNVNGTNERVDFNVFNGTAAELRKLCID